MGTDTLHDALDRRKRVKAIVSSASGNLVEWYDFYAYSFTSIYFASQFFPSDGDTVAELLKAAGVFFIGFLMRPIGGWIFGRVADRYGRKRSMLISVMLMCFGSLLIAILPTYETIGIMAGILLLIVRMLQGLSVGGEYGTTATYMSEVALKGRRGFFSSFQYVTLVGGQLLASLVIFLLALWLSEDQLRAWGWRIPFAIGAVAAIVALYLRSSLHETASVASKENKEAGSVLSLLRNHGKAFLLVVGFTAGGSLTFYTYTTYMQKFLITTTGFNSHTATTLMTGALFIFMCLQPLFGSLADKIGTRTSLLIWSVLSILLTIPMLTLIGNTQSIWVAFFGIVAMLCVACMYTSIGGIVKAEMFPASVRALGVGLSYAVANAIFGGSAETIALWLKDIGYESTFYYYVTAVMVLAFISALLMPDARKSGYLQDHSID
ncbi:MFS family transporter [Bartonella tamiae]|uniref:Alpha-ketoglutarate permease n=1 Tax=Bartonella tamiae Th239 TaxID=1094558 RepID=J0QZH5_9HYPH|nr:MFS family transporter [Bartonella tamiae]EJF88639.1 MFS transporter, metabolite:H+ symporter (MHS) family protein [Bartonella tamiae Th239]EJF95111.1 MFS transporter, metabolite:H+ symporter (MHS) family protein [Bartonella tamiae Th307]